MDWINDFQTKFNQYPEVKNLKNTEFHGSLTINFCGGVPTNYDLKLHRRAVNIDGIQKTTLTEGEQGG